MVRVIHPGLPLDIRVLLSGYLPNYAYDLGATNTSVSFEKLRETAKIHDNAVQADTDPLFSARIREGIPVPQLTTDRHDELHRRERWQTRCLTKSGH